MIFIEEFDDNEVLGTPPPDTNRDSVLGIDTTESMFDGDNLYKAMPLAKWGDPRLAGYFSSYVVRVIFMGKSLLWHKWAVVPLMKVEADLIAGGWDKKYYWTDLQTYCYRVIAGTSILSNHSWPTAIDINPAKNPMRYDNKLVTDIPSQVVAIFKKHGFKWGGEYRTVKDAMHFEYLGEPVKDYPSKRVLKLRPILMNGDDVTEAQQLLIYYGYNLIANGIFDVRTDAMVRSFQASKMLEVDGIIGKITWSELTAKKRDRVLKQGDKGQDVVWIQKVLRKIGVVNWTDKDIDGIYGKNTLDAVKKFQGQNKLTTDGIIGPNTWKMLRFKSN